MKPAEIVIYIITITGAVVIVGAGLGYVNEMQVTICLGATTTLGGIMLKYLHDQACEGCQALAYALAHGYTENPTQKG